MKKQLGCTIVELHKLGYTQDFALFGSELLWAQEQTLIREPQFIVEKYHKIYSPKDNTDYMVLGILATDKAARGILLVQYNYVLKTPSVVFKKLKSFAGNALKTYTQ